MGPTEDLPILQTPVSRVMVDATVDVAAVLAEVHQSVPRVVAEASAVDAGEAGRLSFRVERGEFSLDLKDKRVGVKLPLRASAVLCRPLGPLGCVEIARCQPEAVASAHIVPLLDESYRFPSPVVAIELTKRCTLTAFAIDVTPRLQAEANTQAEKLRARIEAALPDVRASLAPLWDFVATTLPLGRGACARVVPAAVVQTGPRLANGVLRGGVGIEGQLSVESPCGKPSPRRPLPPPELREIAGPGVDLRVPFTVPWEEASRGAAQSLDRVETRFGAGLVHVIDARFVPLSAASVALILTVSGELCGEVVLLGTPAWRTATNGLALDGLRRAGLTGPDPGALIADVAAALRVPLPVDITSLGSSLRRNLSALLPAPGEVGFAKVSAEIGETRVERVVVTSGGLAAVVVASGEVSVALTPR